MVKSPASKRSFRRRITRFICLGTTGLVVAGFALRYTFGYHLVRSSRGQEQTKIAQAIAASVVGMLDEKIEDINVFMASPAVRQAIRQNNLKYQGLSEEAANALARDQNETTNHLAREASLELRRLIEHLKDVAQVFILDHAGQIVASSHQTLTSFQGDDGWWQTTFNEGRGNIFIGDLSFDQTHKLWHLPLAVPLYDKDGQVVGACRVLLDTNKFFSFLSGFQLGQTGHAVLIDQEARIVFHPQGRRLNSHLLSQADYLRLAQARLQGITADIPNLHDDQMFIAAARVNYPFLLRKGQTWQILVIKEAREVFAPLQGLVRQGLILGGFVIVALGIVAFILAQLFVNPLQKLHDATQRISQGDWDYKIDIHSGDEIEELATAFMAMAGNIKLKQSQLLQDKAYQENMVASMHEGIVMLDQQNNLIVLNNEARHMLGLGPEGEVEPAVFKGRIQAFGLDVLFRECRDKQHLTSKEIASPYHQDMIVFCEVSPVNDKEEKTIGLVATLRDITRQKEIDQAKTGFISIVSHELRTPLAVTKEGLSLVLDKIPGPLNSPQDKILTTSKKNIERLERIINNLLDASRIEAGKIEAKRKLIDLAQTARGVASTFEAKAKAMGLTLIVDSPPQPVRAYADEDKIIQVFTNLVGNAFKFTKKGFIKLAVRDSGDKVQCAVSDSGPGIAKEDLARVFDKFHQLKRTAGAGEKGTGLGLTITKQIVKLHKGEIWAESVLDKGSRFIFTLPKYTAAELLRENIEHGVAAAQRAHSDLSLLVLKLGSYPPLEARLGSDNLTKLLSQTHLLLEDIIEGASVVHLPKTREFVLLANISKIEAQQLAARLRQALKHGWFDLFPQEEIDFFYGFSTFPDDGDAEELLAEARANLVNERAVRLTRRILIVDDEAAIIDSLTKTLKIWGYQNITEARDGLTALEAVARQIPDLIILDMKMPQMSGYEVIGRLKEQAATVNIPILIMSGYAVELEKVKQHLKTKVILTVQKPLDMKQLAKFVYYLL